MNGPYRKAIRHAQECARRGLSVESCGYKSTAWRSAWLKAYQEAKQMNFELDDFNDDVKIAEGKINGSNHAGSSGKTENETHGNNGVLATGEQEAAGSGTTHPRQELGLFGGISNSDYHRGPGESSSSIKPALKSLNLYNETKCGRVPFEETVAMRLGSAVHALTLEAYDFGNQIAVSKKFGRKKDDLLEKAEFYKEHEGKIVINADDYETCCYMRDSLLNLSEVREIFETGKPEQSGYYLDRDKYGSGTNMLCKYRPDWENEWCIADIKSTLDASAEAFSRTMHKLNYPVSAAHYLEGSRILTGQEHNQFLFLCVESKAPYEACVYRLGDESLECGLWLRRQALDQIKACRASGEWPLLNGGVAQSIELPAYALNDMRLSKV